MFNKIKCNNCGTTNNKDSKFCSQCGSIVNDATCNACGSKVSPDVKFCPDCGSPLSQLDNSQKKSETIVSTGEDKIKMWSRGPLEFAKRIEVDNVKGTFTKKVTIEQGTKALFLQGGHFNGELLPGTYNVGGLIQKIENLNFSEKATVIVIDDSDVRIEVNVSGLKTSEHFETGIKGAVSLNISNAILFFNNIMKGRSSILLTDIENYLENEISNVLQSKIKNYSYKELYGNDELKNEIKQDLQYKLQTTFDRSGLRIIDVPYFDYDESSWADINAEKSNIGKDSAKIDNQFLADDLEDKRFELQQRIRERLTSGKIDDFKNSDDFATFIHELDKDKLIREDEMDILKRTLRECGDDHTLARSQIIDKLKSKHSHDMATDEQDHKYGYHSKEVDHKHEIDSKEVDHDIEREKKRKENEIDLKKDDAAFTDERRAKDLEFKTGKIDQLIEQKRKMNAAKLERMSGEQDIDINRMKSEAEIEAEKLKSRSGASDEALLSIVDGAQGSQLHELAMMKAAKGLSEEQLMALNAKDSAAVADALKAKYSTEEVKKLYEEKLTDQKKFVDKIEELSDKSADRAERMSMKSMEQMGLTASTRANAPGSTTVVSGGGGGFNQPIVMSDNPSNQQKEIVKVAVCRECNQEVPIGTQFCTNCGGKI